MDANEGYFNISISWSSSVSEVSEWELWGVYMEEEDVIQYYGNQIESYYYDDVELIVRWFQKQKRGFYGLEMTAYCIGMIIRNRQVNLMFLKS